MDDRIYKPTVNRAFENSDTLWLAKLQHYMFTAGGRLAIKVPYVITRHQMMQHSKALVYSARSLWIALNRVAMGRMGYNLIGII